MVSLGSLDLRAVPRVAVSLNDAHIQAAKDAPKTGIDIIETRVDHFQSFDPDYVRKTVQALATLPTIATIRIQKEGGNWSGTDESRIALFRALIPLTDAVDVELQSADVCREVSKLAHDAGKLVIGSFHDFDGTPSLASLKTIVAQGKAAGADIVKIATHCGNDGDFRLLASLLIELESQNLIVIGMGPRGLPSRALYPALGSLLTFAAHSQYSTAPGQLPFPQMFDILRGLYPRYAEYQAERLRVMQGA